jgi:hypothetical protein
MLLLDSLMVEIKFKYVFLKDLQNINESLLNFGGEISVLSNSKKIRDTTNSFRTVPSKTKKIYLKNTKFFNLIVKSHEGYWMSKKKEVIKILEKIFNKRLYSKKFYAYLTSCSRCPYNPKENSFFVSIFASPMQVIYTIAHELFHLQFFNEYVNKIQNKFDTKNDLEEFMEEMIVVLDYELRDKIYGGKIDIKGKKKKILLLWKQSKDLAWVLKKIFV